MIKLFSVGFGSLLVVFATLTAEVVNAQEYISYDELPGFVRHIYLHKDDQITDNCWTNANTVVSKTRLLLENNDIRVIDYIPVFSRIFSPILSISAIGYRTNGLCVGSLSVEVYTYGDLRYGGTDGKTEYSFRTRVSIFSDHSVFSSGTNFNSQIDDYVEGSVSEFLARSVSSRRSPIHTQFFETYPSFADLPMTREAWEKMLNDVKARN